MKKQQKVGKDDQISATLIQGPGRIKLRRRYAILKQLPSFIPNITYTNIQVAYLHLLQHRPIRHSVTMLASMFRWFLHSLLERAESEGEDMLTGPMLLGFPLHDI